MATKAKMLKKMCRCKKRYEFRRDAEQAMQRTKGDDLHTYYCNICSGYHVGHKRKNKRRDPPNGGKLWSVISRSCQWF